MADVKVIHKKSCIAPSADNLVYVKQFLIVEEDGKKYLVPRLVNSRAEDVTAALISVTQYDADGEELFKSEVRVRVAAGAGTVGKPFVPDGKIPLSDETCDCNVSVISAEYGKYTYRADGKSIAVDYNERADELDDDVSARAAYAAKAGKSGITVTKRTAKTPVLVIFALIIALALAVGAVYAHLKYFVAHEKTFLYAGVEYAFEDDDKSDGSNIIVVGYHGARARIVIPESIEGHKVIGVSERAFVGNKSLTSIGFSSAIPIGANAFENCINLREVEFVKITEMGVGAFKNCKKLESVVITPEISRIPQEAFMGCSSLETITVEGGEDNIKIGKNAFANCVNIKTAEILRDIDFNYNSGNYGWFTGAAIERLHITSYNVDTANAYNTAIASMFGVAIAIDHSDANLKELVIDRLDCIPAGFCENLPLTSFEVKSVGSSAIADYAFINCGNLSKFVFPQVVTSVGERAFYGTALTSFNGVALEQISNGAFGECRNLKSFTVASNSKLTWIGNEAFRGCAALTSFTLPSGVTEIAQGTFENCVALADFKFARGASVGSIGDGAFSGCSALKEFKLPDDKLNKIGINAFADCVALENFNVTENVYMINDGAFSGCTSFTSFVLPDNVMSFGQGALRGCDSLAELTVPYLGDSLYGNSYLAYTFGATNKYSAGSSVVPKSLATVTVTGGNAIESYAFYGCTDILSINLPQTTETIGESAFADCRSLLSIELPNGVTRIGDRAFNGCSAFETLEVPRGASYIGYDAFGKCTGLKKLSVPFVGETSATNVFLSYMFGNADYSSGGSMCVPSSLESIEVTNATAIGYYAFNNCDDIREVILPDGLLTIGRYAFSGCDSLTSLEVPNSVTEISAGAFFNSAFEELSLPFVGRSRSTVANEYDETKQLSYVFNSEYYYMPQTLKKITITDSRYIAVNAFTGFTELEQITLDCAMEYISYNAFDGCYRLFEVFDYGSRLNIVKGSIDNGGIAQYALKVHTDRDEEPLPQYKSDDYRFVRDDDGNMHMLDCKQDEETLILPSTVALDGITVNNYSVWRRLFYGNGAITAVVIPASVTDLGETAFGGCNNLERVEFAANSPIKQIKAETFMFCNSLYELTLPQGLTQIEMLAFYNCSRLKKITVPSGVTAIRDGAFLNCQRLFEVYNHSALNIVVGSTDHGGIAENARAVYKDDSQSIDSITVNGVQYMKLGDGGTDWWAVDYYGSDGVLEIKPFAYNGATIDRIGVYDSAFSNNYRILSAVISNAVAQIDRQFSTCYNLSEVRLVGGGANAKMTISDEAFVYCYNLVQFISETPVSSIGKHAFRTDNISLIRFEARVDSVSAEAFYNENTNSIFNAEFADVGTFETRSVASANLNFIKATGTVDAIAQNAFIGQNMTSAEFADVGEIGSYAFANCTSLKTAKFGNVDKIGDYAFSYTGLTSATFGRVNSIGASAFIGTRSLNRIVLAQNDGLTIGNAAFERSGLTSFTYGGKISSIGTGAFTSNSNLSRVSFGEVGTIGSNAFSDCQSLTTAEFAGNVDRIGEYAFRYAPMSSLVFGGKVGTIGANAFRSTGITSLTFTHDVSAIGQSAFWGCNSLKSVQFNGTLATLGGSAFAACSALTQVKLPSSLSVIETDAFGSCVSLGEIVVTEGVAEIRSRAFANCNGLHRIELPSTLTAVASDAFDGCEYVFAVYNKSRLDVGNGNYFGDVIVVSSDANKTLLTYHAEDAFEFVKADGEWYLYNVGYSNGGMTLLPIAFDENGERVTGYYIRGGATRNVYNGLLVSKGVKGLRRNSVRDGLIVYFDGTAQAWRALDGSNNVSATVLYRADCLHEDSADGLWRYDDRGYPTTALTVLDDSAWTVTKQPTCTEYGTREATCPQCKKKITERVEKTAHNFGADDKCVDCGKLRIFVNKNTISDILAIKNDSRYPFDVSDNGEIKSTNKVHDSSSTFTLTADGAMTVTFDIRVSSEASYDKFIVRIGSVEYYSISGTQSIADITVYLNAGDVLTFTYSKDGSDSSGDDCGYITNMTLVYTED